MHHSRNPLGELNDSGYATFPRRKRYSWYRPEDTLQDRRVKAERRRTQLLEECSTDENDDQGNISIGEWIALVTERDRLFKESLKQENEEAKRKFVSDLQHLLLDVPDFSPQEDVDIVRSVGMLKNNLQSYCKTHKISEPLQLKQGRPFNYASSPKPPVPRVKPKLPRKSISTASCFAANKVHVSDINSTQNLDLNQKETRLPDTGPIPVITKMPLKDKEGAKPSPLSIPPPPPPPPPVSSSFQTESHDEERRYSYGSLPNSNCSSISLQDEIATHKKDNLKHVSGPKTPGGTPVRFMEPTDMLQRALMKKFRAIHVHSTPKRGGLMESGSIEVSNTWSEWGTSMENIHQYAFDPDMTRFSRDFTDPPLQSSVRSAADFESMLSSPGYNS